MRRFLASDAGWGKLGIRMRIKTDQSASEQGPVGVRGVAVLDRKWGEVDGAGEKK